MLARPVFVFWVYINLITVGCKTMKNALQKSLPDIVHYLWNIGFGKPGHIIPNCTIKSLLIFIHWNDLRCISSFYVSLDNRSILINMHNCKFLTSEYGKKKIQPLHNKKARCKWMTGHIWGNQSKHSIEGVKTESPKPDIQSLVSRSVPVYGHL